MKIKENIVEYNGVVKLELYKGKTRVKTVKTHNAGKIAFYQFLCRLMQGKTITSERPMYIIPLEGTSHTPIFSKGVSYSSVVGPTTDTVNETASVTYTFVLPGTLLAGRTITGFKLQGYASNAYVDYAESFLQPENYLTLDMGDNLTASWVLTFGGSN